MENGGMTLIDGEGDTVKVEFIPLACMWAYFVPEQEVLSWSLGAFHPQVKAPVLLILSIGKLGPKEGAFGHLANWPFEANKAFEKLCLLRLV